MLDLNALLIFAKGCRSQELHQSRSAPWDANINRKPQSG